MPIPPATYELGPDNGMLAVRTRKAGAASMAGHDLLIEVTAWNATLALGEAGSPASIELTADSGSLEVAEGTGGLRSLGDDDRASIKQRIDRDVLKGTRIQFRSTAVQRAARADGEEQLSIDGQLELAGRSQPIRFELSLSDDGRIAGQATVRQSGWGIKPYAALFGTLKVLDEVTVEVAARLPATESTPR